MTPLSVTVTLKVVPAAIPETVPLSATPASASV